jgi:hypothetical protein
MATQQKQPIFVACRVRPLLEHEEGRPTCVAPLPVSARAKPPTPRDGHAPPPPRGAAAPGARSSSAPRAGAVPRRRSASAGSNDGDTRRGAGFGGQASHAARSGAAEHVDARNGLDRAVADAIHDEVAVAPHPLDTLVFNANKLLSFDRVFFPRDDCAPDDPSSPAAVFASVALPLVDASTRLRFNATLLTYGQTGAGKSHALSGLVRPIVAALVERVGVAALMFRMIEIHNDALIDLLRADGDAAPAAAGAGAAKRGSGGSGGGGGGAPRLQLRDTEQGQHIENASIATIDSEDDALWLFEEAFRRRATAATGMNASSSRSHAIFTVFVAHADGSVSKLNLVDLAGSERQKKTNNTGARMKESVSINSDLLAMGNVLRAVAAGQTHVPYRQCKLTRVLQDSIGGTSITTFLACVSPLSSNRDETLRTMQYCAVASAVLNTPLAVLPPPPPPPPPTQSAGEPVRDDEAGGEQATRQRLDAVAVAPDAPCARCATLSAALDRSESHAFKLENELADMSQALAGARTDLAKDERIFVAKFRDARRLERENAELRRRVAELEAALEQQRHLQQAPIESGALAPATSARSLRYASAVSTPTLRDAAALSVIAAPPTSSRFAGRVRGPRFSHDDDDDEARVGARGDSNGQSARPSGRLLPSVERASPVPPGELTPAVASARCDVPPAASESPAPFGHRSAAGSSLSAQGDVAAHNWQSRQQSSAERASASPAPSLGANLLSSASVSPSPRAALGEGASPTLSHTFVSTTTLQQDSGCATASDARHLSFSATAVEHGLPARFAAVIPRLAIQYE